MISKNRRNSRFSPAKRVFLIFRFVLNINVRLFRYVPSAFELVDLNFYVLCHSPKYLNNQYYFFLLCQPITENTEDFKPPFDASYSFRIELTDSFSTPAEPSQAFHDIEASGSEIEKFGVEPNVEDVLNIVELNNTNNLEASAVEIEESNNPTNNQNTCGEEDENGEGKRRGRLTNKNARPRTRSIAKLNYNCKVVIKDLFKLHDQKQKPRRNSYRKKRFKKLQSVMNCANLRSSLHRMISQL